MMWFLGILWTVITFMCGLGWDLFVWLWQEIPFVMFFATIGPFYLLYIFGSLIVSIFGFIGSLFGD